MYERHFESDWDSLSQEEAMFRAFALGVDAALSEPDEAELEALQRDHHRGLIQIAFDEGKTRATDELRERGGTTRTGSMVADFEPGDREWGVWEDLVVNQEDDDDAFETVEVSRSRMDLPSAVEKPGFLDRPDQSDERITLPRFLLR